MTRDEIIADLKTKYPVMKSGNDNDGYIVFTDDEYEAKIQEWADYEMQVQTDKAAEAKKEAAREAAKLKLEALGLTLDDLVALGL
jgi:hypothetical protein